MNYELHEISRAILGRYAEKTARSSKHFETAKEWLPGGDTRRASYYSPYPLFAERGQGCYLYDCDGNKYIDMLNNYTSLIHGHAHPRITEAAEAELKRGVVLGTNTEIQYRHAEHLCHRMPSMEQVRYCNSGTEAAMLAMRVARAFTGRHAILKMDGGYHGMGEYSQVNMFPDPSAKGTPSVYADPWISKNILKDIEVIPFNDLAAAEIALKKHHDRLAAVIMEPMFSAGGAIPPEPGYLAGMRELTKRYNVLLIYDEVMVFRLNYGGLQSHFGVKPDITILGKIIGGGFPIGALGGRRDIMNHFSPSHSHPVFHSGTFSGNNMSLTAGLVALKMYDQPAIERLNSLGDRLRKGFREALEKAGITGHVTGIGSILAIHWTEKAPRNAGETFGQIKGFGANPISRLLHIEMINRGVFSAPRGQYALTTPMTETEIDRVIEAFIGTLETLKPLIAEVLPNLIIG
jgi:glutamate-1-semialdehyde 2,1-aminomutase